jgi:hypothetical protein
VSAYALSHLSDPVLLRALATLVAQDRATTAALLAHLAEVDARRLYLPAAYPSLFAYCVGELRMSEDTAYKRIRAARTARQFPAIFGAMAEGRLHLAGIVLLAPYLTPENANGLLAAATHRTKAEIERLLAERFPRPDLPEQVRQLAPGPVESRGLGEFQLVPEPVESREPGELRLSPGTVESRELGGLQLAPGPVESHGASSAPGRIEAPAPPSRLAPLAPERYAVQFTIGQAAHDDLRYAQALLGHQLPSGDIGTVFERALRSLVGELERRKFAATTRPRPKPSRTPANPRHIPSSVKRTVWERDGGQCTFVSAAGQRCAARSRLEYDHVEPVARGGRSTVAGLRLRCRAHNQYAAECAFGTGFMDRKREAASAAAAARARAAAEQDAAASRAETEAARAAARAESAAAREAAALRAQAAAEVIPWLRQLGFRADEARRAAARCEDIPNAPLEQRVKVALSCFAKPPRGRTAAFVPAAT